MTTSTGNGGTWTLDCEGHDGTTICGTLSGASKGGATDLGTVVLVVAALVVIVAIAIAIAALLLKRRRSKTQDKTAYVAAGHTSTKVEQSETEMFCHHCGARIPRDSTFCKECGAKL